MYFYIGRELVPALVIFTVAFVLLGLFTLGLFVAWKAGKQIVLVLSRKLTALEAQSQMTRKKHMVRADIWQGPLDVAVEELDLETSAVLRVASESGVSFHGYELDSGRGGIVPRGGLLCVQTLGQRNQR